MEAGEIRPPVDVVCPVCHSRLSVEPITGEVLDAERPHSQRGDFDQALGALSAEEAQREQQFLRAFQSERHRRELLEKKFDSARRKAGADADRGRDDEDPA